MRKLQIALKSRTTWVLIGLFVLNGIVGIREYLVELPGPVLELLDGALVIAGTYFRVNRKAD